MVNFKGSLDWGLLVLRVGFGLGMAYHGYGKVFGGQVSMLAQGVEQWGLPFPIVWAWAAALSEFAGGILLVIGFKARIAAFFVFVTMAVAFFKAHGADPFQVKELAAAYGVAALGLMFTGPGSYSIDRK